MAIMDVAKKREAGKTRDTRPYYKYHVLCNLRRRGRGVRGVSFERTARSPVLIPVDRIWVNDDLDSPIGADAVSNALWVSRSVAAHRHIEHLVSGQALPLKFVENGERLSCCQLVMGGGCRG